MRRGKSKKPRDLEHLGVANPIRPEDLDRRVTRHGIYPSLPTSQGVPWSTYMKTKRSQKVSSRSISSSTEALDSEQARMTTRRILQHTRSLPTHSPVQYASMTDREYRSDSGLSERYTTRIPMVRREDESSYTTEYGDYALLGNRTPTTSSIGGIVRPKIRSVTSQGSFPSKGEREGKPVVPPRSSPLIGESAGMFTDMTDTMLKVLDRRAAIAAQARELENTLAENAYALGQCRQKLTGYVPSSVASPSLYSQPSYMNTVPRLTSMGIPVSESTPIPQMGPVLHRPMPAPRMRDILEPIASEQARARYLDEQMKHMKSKRPSTPSDRSRVSANLAREIQEYCSLYDDYGQDRKDTHQAMLESMKEQKAKQRQQGKKEQDEVYKQMTRKLENVRAIARESLSRASTVSVEERQMALSRTDILHIKDKMNKLDQKIKGLHQNWQAEYREAVTSEQCDAIQKFYEPHVQKYELKCKVLYDMLQKTVNRSKIPSSRVSVSTPPRVTTPELTPSLAGLEDATTLKEKVEERSMADVKRQQIHPRSDEELIPTAPTHRNIGMETSFSRMMEDSSSGLSAAVGGTEIEQERQQLPTSAEEMVTVVAPPATIDTRPKGVIESNREQGELPRRTDVTREASRGRRFGCNTKVLSYRP